MNVKLLLGDASRCFELSGELCVDGVGSLQKNSVALQVFDHTRIVISSVSQSESLGEIGDQTKKDANHALLTTSTRQMRLLDSAIDCYRKQFTESEGAYDVAIRARAFKLAEERSRSHVGKIREKWEGFVASIVCTVERRRL